MQAGNVEIPDSEFTLRFSRSGGPGGQNVNKVSSRVQLRWNVSKSPSLPDALRQRFMTQFRARVNEEGELLLDCDETRSQHKNREICLQRLMEMLLAAQKPQKRRIATKPTKASKRRNQQQRIKHSQKKANRRKVDWDE